MNPPAHTKFIVGCITLLSGVFGGCGFYLILRGYQAGELYATTGGMGLSGLIGFLGGKMAANASSTSSTQSGDITNTAIPAKPEIKPT